MKYPVALFCSLCMLLLWAACDSQGGKLDSDCLGEVTLSQALEDTTAYVGDSLTLALGGDHLAFEQTAGRHMSYAVDSDESFVNVAIVDRAVQVTSSQPGEAQIRVQAVDACDQQAEAFFTVRFLDPCSPSPPPGEASFMPVQVGDSWTYVYENHNRFGRDVTQDSGRVHLTAIAAECSQGQRLVTLQQEVQLERWSRWTIWDEEEGEPKDTTAVSQIEEVQQVELVEYEDGRVLHPFATQPFMRFHPATRDTVEVEGGQVRVHGDFCGVGLMSLYLTKEQGLVSASFIDCFGSVYTSASGYLELVASQ